MDKPGKLLSGFFCTLFVVFIQKEEGGKVTKTCVYGPMFVTKKMKLSKSLIENICRDYMEFLLHEAGQAVSLEKIMGQAERFKDVLVYCKGKYYIPYTFALIGGRDRDIEAVHYGVCSRYGVLRNVICYVEKGKLSSVTFSVDLPSGYVIRNIMMEELLNGWSMSGLDLDSFDTYMLKDEARPYVSGIQETLSCSEEEAYEIYLNLTTLMEAEMERV